MVEYNQQKESNEIKVFMEFWLRKTGYGVMDYMFGILESVDINNEKAIAEIAKEFIYYNIEQYISIYEEEII